MRMIAAVAFCMLPVLALAQGKLQPGDIKQIGDVENFSGKVTLSVQVIEGKRRGMLFITDRHRIKSNLMMLDARELQAMRGLIDATLADLSPDPQAAGARP